MSSYPRIPSGLKPSANSSSSSVSPSAMPNPNPNPNPNTNLNPNPNPNPNTNTNTNTNTNPNTNPNTNLNTNLHTNSNPRSKHKVPTLLASASKILKPGAARGQTIAHTTSSTPLSSFQKIETPPSYIPVKRAAYGSPAPSPLSPHPSSSPPDKPLPSLPVATVVGKSPIQSRSLIDAAERPLRRSVSLPPPGQVTAKVEEEWPALSPYRPALNQYDARLARPAKPSVGESVLEAMRDLHIGYHGNKTSSLQPDKEKGPVAVEDYLSQSAVSALPPPPAFGKTKTADRRRPPPRAAGSSGGDKPKADNDNISSSLPHSRSGLYHTATGRGSPYTLVTNSSNESIQQYRQLSRESLTPLHAAQSVAGKEAKAIVTAHNKRKTSIPVPSRLVHRLHSDESESNITRVKFRRGSHQYRELSPSDADVDSDHKSAKSDSLASAAATDNKPANAPAANIISFTEMMATPAPTRRQVRRPAPDPDQSPFYYDELGYDCDGGFEVKKIRAPAHHPDTASSALRVTDSARKLLGEKSEQAYRQASAGSHFTKPSDVIKSTMQLTRTLTNRSVVRLSSAPTLAGSVKGEDAGDDDGNSGDETAIKHGQSQESLVQSKNPALSKNLILNKIPVLATQTKTSQNPTYHRRHHHDWPLKDFNSFAAIADKDRAKRPSSSRTSSDSSWIPPADWGIKTRPSDLELTSYAPPVFTNDAKPAVPALRNHFSSPTPPLSARRPSETAPVEKIEAKRQHEMAMYVESEYEEEFEDEDDFPPPTPEKDAIYRQAAVTSPSPLNFPLRTSSKAAVVGAPTSQGGSGNGNDNANASANVHTNTNANGHLSPIHELSEQTLASLSRLVRADSHNTLRFFAPSGPAFAASAATTPTPYAAAPDTGTTPAGAASGSTTASKATPRTVTMVSALRNLFHKKSSELGRGHGSVRSSGNNKRIRVGPPQPYRPSTPLHNDQHSYNHGVSFGAASSTPTLVGPRGPPPSLPLPPPPPPPTPVTDKNTKNNENRSGRGGGRVIETDGGQATSAAAPHLIAQAVAAARDAQDALAQARLAVAQCEQCVDRTNAIVAQLRAWA